jgi:septal ring factor EnvC (AmiA/AmiB activator)
LERKIAELRKSVKNNPQLNEDIRKTREEILSLKRELNRTKRFTEVSSNKLAEGKTSIDSISASNLMRLDKELSKDRR